MGLEKASEFVGMRVTARDFGVGASGQSCVAGSRLYVQDSVADGFLDNLVSKASGIKIGGDVEDAIVISLGPHHSFPLEEVFDYLKPELILTEEGVASTIVVFGGTRVVEPSAARASCARDPTSS